MNANPELIQQLKQTSLFRDFTEAEINECLGMMEREEHSAGTCIVQQDEPGEAMYLLIQGRARVVHHQDGHDVQLAQLEMGDFFGEIALVDRGPRSADVEALTDCVMYRINQATLSALAGVYPTAAFKFLIAV